MLPPIWHYHHHCCCCHYCRWWCHHCWYRRRFWLLARLKMMTAVDKDYVDDDCRMIMLRGVMGLAHSLVEWIKQHKTALRLQENTNRNIQQQQYDDAKKIRRKKIRWQTILWFWLNFLNTQFVWCCVTEHKAPRCCRCYFGSSCCYPCVATLVNLLLP